MRSIVGRTEMCFIDIDLTFRIYGTVHTLLTALKSPVYCCLGYVFQAVAISMQVLGLCCVQSYRVTADSPLTTILQKTVLNIRETVGQVVFLQNHTPKPICSKSTECSLCSPLFFSYSEGQQNKTGTDDSFREFHIQNYSGQMQ